MKKSLITILIAGLVTLSAYGGDLWQVESGSYYSTDFNSLVMLYNTLHGTNRYRAIRDVLIAQGTLRPCYPGQIVEAIAYNGGVATIIGRDGTHYYIPQEDFTRFLGNRLTELDDL